MDNQGWCPKSLPPASNPIPQYIWLQQWPLSARGGWSQSLVFSSLPSQPATLPSASLDFFLPGPQLEPSHSPALGPLPTRDPFPNLLSSTVA